MRNVWKVMPHLMGALVGFFLSAANAQTRTLQSLTTTRPTSVTQDLRSGNRVVAVQVNHAGWFSIGTADDRALLYDFPKSDYRSHVNVWLDGRLFSNDSSRTRLPVLALLRPPELLADSTIVCQYDFDGMLLEQRLRHEQYSDSTGAIFIQYVLTNPTNATHETGLLLELDTKVNDNDKTPFLTNFGYGDLEVTLHGDSIPDFLQAFEALPPAPGLVAKFTLFGAAATPPDFVAIGDWINLSKVHWDYIPSTVKYNDSAVLLRWNPVALAPGESRAFGTYYGVGEVTSRTDTLTLSVIAPERLLVQSDTLSPNPFSVSAFVTNTSFAAAHNVRVRLLLPEALQLAAGESSFKEIAPRDLASQTSGTATWKVQARCVPADSLFHMNVEVTSDDAPGNTVTRALHVPTCFGSGFTLALQPRSASLVAGDSAQVLVGLNARGNFNEEVALELWPALPGIDFTFTPPRVRRGLNSQLAFKTRNTLLPGTYSFVVNGRSAIMQASDTLRLQIKAALVDLAPPFTRNHNPAMNARNVLPETAIAVEVQDDGAGVDSSALAMWVNDVRVAARIFWFDQKRARLEYQPAAPFLYNETVRVTLRARDLANPPNEMPEEHYTFALVTDVSPPFLTDLYPPRDAAGAAPNTEISFHLRDDLAGVDSTAILLAINGVAVQPKMSGTPRDLLVRYQPPPFLYNEQVTVSIRAQDLSNPPNEMPETRYTFTVVQDLVPPFITDVQPAHEAQHVGANTEISFHVRDEIAGVDSAAIVLNVNDVTVTPRRSGTRHDVLVRFQPAQPFAKGQTVRVRVTARDLSSPPNVMPPRQYSFRVAEPVYDLIAESLQPLGELRAGVLTNIAGEVRNGLEAVTQSFRVLFLVDGATVKDTLLTGLNADQQMRLTVPVRFVAPGTHEITMRVDANNNVPELSESNNQQNLFVEILPPLVREFSVRPNPFTPNQDGYNDAVEFNFATLGLSAPALRIFDVEGLAVLSEDNLSAGVFVWHGRDRHGRALPPGIYLYSLQERGKNVANGYVVLAR